MAETKIFISYARRDGKALANRLRDDLKNAGYEVWLDTSEIEGGASWSLEIEQAIDGCEVTLALLSTGSYTSEICRAEQLRALRKGKRVIPVLVQPSAERPLPLEHLNYRDFTDMTQYDEQFKTLKGDIVGGAYVPLPAEYRETRISRLPPLPDHFIDRFKDLDRLRQALLSDQTDRRIALTALHGLGGIGKSVLANAICRDTAIQDAFPDGVIWVEVGRNPGNLIEQMRLIGTRLGDTEAHYQSHSEAIDRLRGLLPSKAALLVLDDVWETEHLEPFVIEAPRCRVLITTRNKDVAVTPTVRAHVVRLGTLEPQEAVHLLYERTGHDDPDFPAVARELGYLPLALAIVGPRLAEGMSAQDWLKSFSDISQIKLKRRPKNPHESLELCFDLSANALGDDVKLYYTLGIFPEDVWVPQTVVVRLWRHQNTSLSERWYNELIEEFEHLALLDRNEAEGTLWLHDLLHDYTREHLGDQYIQTHLDLLAAYNPDGKLWSQIPHDGYLYYRLAYHLREAERCTELYNLLTISPAWMEAKFASCVGDTSYASDLDRAIVDFTDPLTADQALILAQLHAARQVVHARVSIYNDTDLNTLVWLGRAQEALSHAWLRAEAIDQFKGLLSVYEIQKQQNHPNISLLSSLLPIARSIRHVGKRALALLALASALTQAGDEQASSVYQEAEKVARDIQDERKRVSALRALASALTQAKRYEEARKVAHSIQDVGRKADALRELATVLAQAGDELASSVFQEAGEVAHSIRDEGGRVVALSKLAVDLTQIGDGQASRVFQEAGEVAHSIQDEGGRAVALSKLAVDLTQIGDGQASRVFQEAGEVARGIQDEEGQAVAVRAVAVALAQAGRYEEALAAARGIQSWGRRQVALRAVASALAQAGRYEEASKAAHSIQEKWGQAVALRAVAVALAQSRQYEKAVVVARGIQDERRRVTTLSELALALAQAGDKHVSRVCQEAVTLAHGIKNEKGRVDALREVAAVLAQVGDKQASRVYQEAGEMVRSVQDVGRRALALSALASALAQAGDEQAGRVYSEAEKAARSVQDEGRRAVALSALAEALVKAGRYDEAEMVACSIQKGKRRAEALRAVAVALAQTGRYDEAEGVARSIQDEVRRAEALRAVAVALAQSERYEGAERVARSIQEEVRQVWALSTLALVLAQARDEQASRVYQEAEEVARGIQDKGKRASALRALALVLAQAGDEQASRVYQEAEEVARGIQDGERRAWALRALAEALAKAGDDKASDVFQEAREVARSIQDEGKRAEALSALAEALAKAGDGKASGVFQEAREVARSIQGGAKRAGVLSVLASALIQTNHIGTAFVVLGKYSLDDFIQIVAEWHTTFQSLHPDLGGRVLREVVRIIGWEQPSWRYIHALLTTNNESGT